jgi:hypothetical protein
MVNPGDKLLIKQRREKRARERQVFHEEVWPTLLVRLRLAGAPLSVIDHFKAMRSRYRWSQRYRLIDEVKRYESQLTHERSQ